MRADAQIFVHVLAAMVLFGAFATVALLSLRARFAGAPPVVADAAFRTLAILALPAWLVMFIFGNWAKSKEHLSSAAGWLKLGSGIGVAGVLVLAVGIGISFAWSRSPSSRGLATATGVLASLYVVALAVAWWVMTAKVPS
jgi:hypothetical protein